MQFDIKGMPAIIALIVLTAAGLGYRMFLDNDFKKAGKKSSSRPITRFTGWRYQGQATAFSWYTRLF